jgi:16S rRNA (guanine966-N2)-methyltransferase
MRIIAGRAGGIPLKSPSEGTRPTTDRVREAIFSMLGVSFVDARVLDLFAGSGASGLEALSRGAKEALLVERNRNACATIEDNLRRSKLDGARVIKSEAFAALQQFRQVGARFDLIFADPPYMKQKGDPDYGAQLLASADLRAVLAEGGTFVLETMMTKRAAPVIAGWHIARDRAYGSTRVLLLQPDPTPAPHGETPHAAPL